ncbi:TPA: baseplate J/gp47 family protein [Yersinia enterocolitica]|uniref:baseplate J/gp47 family protein n=1 Tax=Yersinia TaxID=629 RepID=UPI001C610865|nr:MULTISPECIES: baseplate J/gp47 family protein [Yersinia]ELW8952158.1 baseplate J/gp47 family protein [Yersinia enterocolitica]MBW5850175.1 baseplate J/gp47 family protein [Yersinia enterocolitica]HDL6478168.1 baseplate J/gp47 family protein [Yersinia enterocolitica]HDL6746931.1 baseplate J/gp47 family protein [Yersinia enterocolitica]HDL7678872.1 baseplate J/gp47 family protein [Yersinia enterocolitica]
MNNRPNPDYKAILADEGVPTTETQMRAEFVAVVAKENLITNTSNMSPFWRLIKAIVTAPALWLVNALSSTVMANMFLATASGTFIDLFAWAVNLSRKEASTAQGVIRFTKETISAVITVPAGTVIQTERINGTVYKLAAVADVVIPAGVSGALIAVKAATAGSGHNLAPGYFRILPVAVNGIASAVNEDNWLITPGADTEEDDDLRDRVRNQFNLPGQYHIDAVYRGLIAGIASLTTDRIFFLHDAPRGPGTANVYLLLDSGIASQPFIDTVNDYVMSQGNHGHGDDVLCLPLPEVIYDMTVTLHFFDNSNLDDEQRAALLANIRNLIGCAFRENTDYTVQKTWPHSRFSMSRLGEELHDHFAEIESMTFSRGDIISALSVPRLGVLTLENADG